MGGAPDADSVAEPRDRRALLILGGLVLLGLALRLAVVVEIRSDILFDYPTVDAERYVRDARGLAAGVRGERAPYWQPPGIVYALAGVFRVAGSGLLWPRLVGCLFSAACIALAYALARRCFSTRVALAGAAVVALHGVLIHAAAELLPGTWIAFWNLLALVLVVEVARRGRWPWAVGAGLACGIAIIFSPLIVPFLPLAGIWLWRQAPVRRGRLLLVMALLAAAPAAGVALRNYRVGREVVLVSTNGGLNFYLGNNADYHRTLGLRPGRHWEELVNEPRRHGVTAPGRISGYFYRKGWQHVRAHPVAAAARYCRKLYLFWNGVEIPRSTDIYAERRGSHVVTALVWPGPIPFPDGLLLPLALVGLAVSWRRAPSARLLGVYVVAQAAAVACFFVTSRYRIPALVVMAPLAVVGAAWVAERLRAGTVRARAATVAGVLLLGTALNLPTREGATSFAGEPDFYRGVTYARLLRDPERAAHHLARSTAIDPADPRAWFELGNVTAEQGRIEAAAAAWERAAGVDPWDSRPRRRIAALAARRGDFDAAARALRANLDARRREPAHYAVEHFHLGTLDALRGRYASSLAELRAAADLDPRHWREQAPGFVREALSRPGLGDAAFWDGLAALLAETGLTPLAESARQRAATVPREATPGAPPAPGAAPSNRTRTPPASPADGARGTGL
jgi:4-amino-4-deoxy-L-arabinose transferase-like glycosyltransferase